MEERNDSFVFYASFADTYDNLLKSNQPEEAAKFIKAVISYGLYGEYEEGVDFLLDALMGPVKISIDGAQSRYNRAIRRGITGGAPAKYNEEAILAFLDEGHTQKQTAEKFGCSLSTIKRYVKLSREKAQILEVAPDEWSEMF